MVDRATWATGIAMRGSLWCSTLVLPATLAAQAPVLVPTPLVTIHASSPDGEVVIERITDADLLPGGGVVVADGLANTLLFFDSGGTLRRRVGGTGDGPGEFRRLWGVEACGETVVAYEMVGTSLARYGPTGEPRGAVTLGASVTSMSPLRCGPDGGYVAMVEPRPASRPGPGVLTLTFSAGVAWFDSTGTIIAREAVDSALEMVMIGGGGAPSPLGPMLSFAATGEQVLFGTGATATMGVLTPGGAVHRRSLALQPTKVSPADRRAGRAGWLELAPPRMREALAKQYDDLPDPPHLPLYRGMVPASGGVVLLEVGGPGAPVSEYRATDGMRLGPVLRLPTAGTLMAARGDRALLLITDGDGEQRLQIHRLDPSLLRVARR